MLLQMLSYCPFPIFLTDFFCHFEEYLKKNKKLSLLFYTRNADLMTQQKKPIASYDNMNNEYYNFLLFQK